ncbi:MAG: hypothetical protein JW840_07400 [Candidatus Thermoplasmatota archaeon]|nr:hypothetical protein [Candidatus Thermoplasmatota archaeon]
MKKQSMKKYVRTLLTGFLFVSIPSVLVAAQQYENGGNHHEVTLELMTDLHHIHEIQLILLMETTEPNTSILPIKQEQQARMTNLRLDKQTSVPNGDFYPSPLFSCRGFA